MQYQYIWLPQKLLYITYSYYRLADMNVATLKFSPETFLFVTHWPATIASYVFNCDCCSHSMYISYNNNYYYGLHIYVATLRAFGSGALVISSLMKLLIGDKVYLAILYTCGRFWQIWSCIVIHLNNSYSLLWIKMNVYLHIYVCLYLFAHIIMCVLYLLIIITSAYIYIYTVLALFFTRLIFHEWWF